MKKFAAVAFSLVLHVMFATGLTATATAAVEIASARAAHTLIG